MKKEIAIRVFVSTARTIPILFSHPAFAEPNDSRPPSPNRLAVPIGSPPPLFEASLNTSYTLPGDAKKQFL
jgi:hypothetical protein